MLTANARREMRRWNIVLLVGWMLLSEWILPTAGAASDARPGPASRDQEHEVRVGSLRLPLPCASSGRGVFLRIKRHQRCNSGDICILLFGFLRCSFFVDSRTPCCRLSSTTTRCQQIGRQVAVGRNSQPAQRSMLRGLFHPG